MRYTVDILRSAQKQLSKFHPEDRDRIINVIYALRDTPRPTGCKKLSGRPVWRIRVGACQMLYEIYDNRLVVLVVAVGIRGIIYR